MSASAQFTITVNLLQSGTPLPTAYTGSAYSSTVATNQYYRCIAPYTFSLQEGSTLPAGLYLSSAGAITGTPTTAGTYNFIIDVLDSSNPQMSASAVFIINVDPGTSATGLLKGQYIYTFYSQLNLNLFYNLNEEAGQVYSVFHSYGVLTFDGNGSVAGTVYAMDDYQLAPGEPGLNVSAPVTGTYSVAADGSGSLQFASNSSIGFPNAQTGNLTLAVATGSASATNPASFSTLSGTGDYTYTLGPGTGTLRLQDSTAFDLSSYSGNYVFHVEGDACSYTVRGGSCNNPQTSAAGVLTLDGAGNLTGFGDFSSSANPPSGSGSNLAPNVPLTGTYVIDDSTSGSITFNVNAPGYKGAQVLPTSFEGYIVSSGTTQLVGNVGSMLFGSVEKQKLSSFDNTSFSGKIITHEQSHYVYSGYSDVNASVYVLNSDGAGNATGTYELINGVNNPPTAISYTYIAASNGRVTTTPTGTDRNPPFVFWLTDVDTGAGIDTNAPSTFFVQPQSTGPFSLATISGSYIVGAPPPAITGDFAGVVVSDGNGNLTTDPGSAAVYSAPDANGRGTVTYTYNSTAHTTPYYIVSPDDVILLGYGSEVQNGELAAYDQFVLMTRQ